MAKKVKSKKSNQSQKKDPLRKYWQINKNSAVLVYKQYCGSGEDKKNPPVQGFCIHSFYPEENTRHLIPSSKSKFEYVPSLCLYNPPSRFKQRFFSAYS